MDSLSRITWRLLRPNNRARALADSKVVKVSMASLRRVSSALLAEEHRDLITLTRTRAPSLLTDTESERSESARMRFKVDVFGCPSSASRTHVMPFSTAMHSVPFEVFKNHTYRYLCIGVSIG